MRTRFFPLFMLSVFAVCAPCKAGDMPDSVRQALNDGLIGAWDLDISRDGEKSKGTYTATWSPGGQSIRIDMSATEKDGLNQASELIGWDADSECLVIQGFGQDSASWTIRFTDLSSKTWKGEWKGYIDGKADGSDCTMELRGDSFEYRDTTDGKPLIIKATRHELDESYKKWWRFLKGEWTYEISPSNEKGTVTWRIAAKGNAMVGRFENENGSVALELSGRQADLQRELVNGYASDGGCWTIEITDYSDDEFEGNNYGVLPDGKPFSGRFVGKRVDDDHYQWTFTGKDGDGNPLTMTGEYARKKQD